MSAHSHEEPSNQRPLAGTGVRIEAHRSVNEDGWSRRAFLGTLGVAAGGLMVPRSFWLPNGPASEITSSSLTGGTPLKLAMHVHGSWSEGTGSWDAQLQQAAANAFDVVYMTDHDFREVAYRYAASLSGLAWTTSSTGTLSQHATTVNGGSIHLLAESASTTTAATVTMKVADTPAGAKNKLRTSIAGTTLTQAVKSARLAGSARFDVVVTLSYHPARSGRPAGQYQLIYRFAGTAARWTESNGLVGVVRAPAPTPGSTQVMKPEQDVARFWPDMLPMDNAFYGLSFIASSPKHGDVADVTVGSLTIARTQSSASSVIANQAKLIAAYQPAYPNLTVRPQTEISYKLPDLNTFGMPQWIPNYDTLPNDNDTRHRQLVSTIHAKGGLASWNHPFGYDVGPLLSAADRITKRRAVFQSMKAVDVFGVDILEVGYALRGQVDAPTHIALWDTFSRNGIFLTGNGTTDDHTGQGWKSLTNGFATGVWAASRSEADIAAALAAGRAFAAHVGRWPGGQLDLLVDDTVPMGGVSVSSRTTRRIAIWATNLPAGSVVQLIAGPVDYSGAQDPGTWVSRTLSTSAFAGGVVAVDVTTTSSRFVRAQVALSTGQVVGTSNPVWLLRSPPPNGIPPARRQAAAR
jgi:hypothetical protein